jgi:hypothetical protein
MESFLGALGAGTNDVLAAFLGSCCGAFALTKPSVKAIVATIFVGTVVGTYVGANLPLLIGIKSNLITLSIGSLGTGGLLWLQKKVADKFFGGNGK